MLVVGLLQRRLQTIGLNYAFLPNKRYCEYKKHVPNVFLLGGGLGKLQGGIKEEEYFSSVNHSLMCKIREQMKGTKHATDYLQNWDEYQKTLDHAALYNTGCMNKHKNCLEEAFFMNESTECVKILNSRVKPDSEVIVNDLVASCSAINECQNNDMEEEFEPEEQLK
ncbi:uncharacterized protein LOC115634235 [Scaptodrosophila lebanonensis]|uniref:Uncharacterized protein LOC115634235 n=1 Tax=Drosophila lebanonensis TaxID=7225 RepID=A0A6J2UH27_DROLE|nr:uncharacterized protein LOC115634235 [Scaptodrosophila lebanonensis]